MRHIIIDPDEGVFLGTKGERDMRIMAMFSAHNILEVTKCVSFNSYEEANAYYHTYLKNMSPSAFIVPIECDSEFVDIVDIVKAGYGSYACDMIDALPMPNERIH